MRKLFKKFVPIVLSLALAIGNITPAFATVTDEHTTHEHNDTLQTEVIYNQESSFSVTIPKLVALEGDKTSYYTVTVEGDISSDEKVVVVPEEYFFMKDISSDVFPKDDVEALVYQDKQAWTFNEFDVEGTGYIEAEGLTAGNWEGSFWFNIELKKLNPLSLSINGLETESATIGSGSELQIEATIDGEDATDLVEWESDSSNFSVVDGLVETTASAQLGDSATITATFEMPTTFALREAPQVYTASLTVTVIDIVYTEVGGSKIITELDIVPGELKEIEATIVPSSSNDIDVIWASTAISGINLVPNGNKVTIKIASDMPINKSYYVISVCGTYTKLIKVNTIMQHDTCDYIETVLTAATCTTDGLGHYKCRYCSSNYEDVILATGHNYKSIVTNSTCTEQGYTTHTCLNCNDSYNDTYVAATGHTSVNGATQAVHTKCSTCGVTLNSTHSYTSSITTAVTCTTAGVRTYTCDCGYKYTESIPATGHSYGTVTYTWSGTSSCTAKRTCSTCSNVESQNATITNAVTTNATCTTAGVRTYTAKFSNTAFATQTKTESIAATGHKSVNGGTSGVHTKCSTCGATLSSTHSYSVDSGVQYSAVTCTAPRYNYKQCSCGYNPKSSSYIVATGSAKGHSYSAWSTNGTQHWKACANGCGTKSSLGNHADRGTDGLCDTCGYKGTIVYTYHSHTGSSTSGGGCYTSKVVSSYSLSCTTAVHSHSDSCYTSYTGKYNSGTKGTSVAPTYCSCGAYATKYNFTYKCTKCGASTTAVACDRCGSGSKSGVTHCSGKTLSCTKTVHSHSGNTSSGGTCYKTVNYKYNLGCGKTTSTVISQYTQFK